MNWYETLNWWNLAIFVMLVSINFTLWDILKELRKAAKK